MVRKVFCRKYQEDLEGMSSPPYPGEKGEDIFNNVSKRAWEEWLEHQKKVFLKKNTYPENYPLYQNKFQKNNFFLIFFTFLLAKNT